MAGIRIHQDTLLRTGQRGPARGQVQPMQAGAPTSRGSLLGRCEQNTPTTEHSACAVSGKDQHLPGGRLKPVFCLLLITSQGHCQHSLTQTHKPPNIGSTIRLGHNYELATHSASTWISLITEVANERTCTEKYLSSFSTNSVSRCLQVSEGTYHCTSDTDTASFSCSQTEKTEWYHFSAETNNPLCFASTEISNVLESRRLFSVPISPFHLYSHPERNDRISENIIGFIFDQAEILLFSRRNNPSCFYRASVSINHERKFIDEAEWR